MSDVATVGTLKSVSPKRDLSTLSNSELEVKARKGTLQGHILEYSGYPLVVGSLPVAIATGSPLLSFSVIALGAVASFVGISIGTRSGKYSDTLETRNAEEERARLKDWQDTTIANLKDRFAIDFDIQDLRGLDYPREAPATNSTVRYGTIEKLIENSEGEGARLEQLTLVWSNGEPRILRAVTELRDINGGAIR